jgi:hypothetical protein
MPFFHHFSIRGSLFGQLVNVDVTYAEGLGRQALGAATKATARHAYKRLASRSKALQFDLWFSL